MNMRKLYLSLIALLVALTAAANDSEYFTCGNQLVPIQNTNIAVAKEVLTVNLTNNGFTNVEVYYEFRNDGPATDILMGFEAKPPYFDGNSELTVGPHPSIHNFVVEMNGKNLPYTNYLSEKGLTNGISPVDKSKWEYTDGDFDAFVSKADKETPLEYAYVYSFKAHFKPGINIVRHSYTYDESYGVGHSFWIDYKLTPATRWANHQIDDFTLRITAKGTSKHFIVETKPFTGTDVDMKIVSGKGRTRMMPWGFDESNGKVYELSVRNAVVEWHVKNFSPKHELWISSADMLLMSGNISDEKVYYDCGVHYAPSYIVPDKSTSLNRRIYRNLPFAIRGYKFNDPKLKNFFNSQWWYLPDPKYNPSKDRSLSKRERKIVHGLFKTLFQ